MSALWGRGFEGLAHLCIPGAKKGAKQVLLLSILGTNAGLYSVDKSQETEWTTWEVEGLRVAEELLVTLCSIPTQRLTPHCGFFAFGFCT